MSVQRELPQSTPKGVFFLSFTFEYISTNTLVADSLTKAVCVTVRLQVGPHVNVLGLSPLT